MNSLSEIINACGLMGSAGITAYGSIRAAKILQGKDEKPSKKKSKKK